MKTVAARFLVALAFAIPCAALAQSFPERPITFVVPFAAGGATDTLARQFADRMSRGSAQPIVIDNVPGAGGTVGAGKVAKAKPDGYTFLVGHVGYMAAAVGLYKHLGYDPATDFDAVARFPDTPLVLVAASNGRFKTVQSLVDAAKAKPGSVNIANAGVGSSGHLVAALFASSLGLDVVHVSYKGNAQALTDILGGQVDCMFDQSNTSLPQVRGGKVVALATTAKTRLPQMPDVPTIDETLVRGFEATTWYGIYGPRGTPRAAIDWLVARFNEAMRDDAFTGRLVADGYVMIPPESRGPEALAAHTKREIEVWKKVIRDAGITPQ